MARQSRSLLLLVGTVLIAGCAARGVRVAELRDRPTRYEDRTVSVRGVVTSSWGIPLVPFKLYKIDDGTGEITVVSQSGRNAPSRGTHVRVKGRVNEIGTFGGQAVGLHLEEVKRNYTGN